FLSPGSRSAPRGSNVAQRTLGGKRSLFLIPPALARWSRLAHGRPGTEHGRQAQVVLDPQRLGPPRAVDAQLREFGIDLALAPAPAGEAGQAAAEVLAPVGVEVAQEVAQPPHVTDVLALGRVGDDLHDGRLDLGPREKDLRMQLAND